MRSAITRRQALASVGGVAAGVLGTSVVSTPAVAETHFEMSLSDTEVETETGELEWVATGLQGFVSWEGFDSIRNFECEDYLTIETEDGLRPIEEHRTLETSTEWSYMDSALHTIDYTDSFETSGDGHVTFHHANPDGTGQLYSQAEPSGTFEWDDLHAHSAWSLVLLEGPQMRDGEYEGELPVPVYSSTYENPAHAEELADYYPELGETTTFTFTLRREMLFYQDIDMLEEAFFIAGSDSFDVTITNVEGGETDGEGTGESGAGG